MPKIRKYKDLDFSFRKHPATDDVVVKTDESAVIQACKSLLMTNFYDRPFHPEIGSQITAILFENITPNTIIMLKDFIINCLTNFEKRVKVLDVSISYGDSYNPNTVAIGVALSINYIIEPVSFSFILERVR